MIEKELDTTISNIEFIEQEHIYLYCGVIIASVSEILRFIFPNKYKDVPQEILDSKAEYGTLVHKYTEMLDNNEELPSMNYIIESSINQYKKLKEKKEYLSWQLSLYELGRGKKYEKLYAIWLPKKGLGQLKEIQRKSKKELLSKLEEFFKIKEESIK